MKHRTRTPSETHGAFSRVPSPESRAPSLESRVPAIPIVLTIAGSDSGGGAGIQADLKTFMARGVHGTSAITAVTAQNTRGVRSAHVLPPREVRAQIEAVFADFPIAAMKIGMLADAATIRAVARALRAHPAVPLVLDPVMIATSGARLLDARAVAVLIDELLPLATVLTPNLPEAAALTGLDAHDARLRPRMLDALLALGPDAVLLKGGHARGHTVTDLYRDAQGSLAIVHARKPGEAHGTGCTLAAALTAELAKGHRPRRAAQLAVAYVQRALARGQILGNGGLLLLRH
ncbi:MAG: bifunctional hydroxymethylpyrimidine kinase/phosphomethylpyrimidine kinase [Metallibacterium sp.]